MMDLKVTKDYKVTKDLREQEIKAQLVHKVLLGHKDYLL
jgi:hypothetical protein